MTESRKRCYHNKNIPLKRVRDFPLSTVRFSVCKTQSNVLRDWINKTELNPCSCNYADFSVLGKLRFFRLSRIIWDFDNLCSLAANSRSASRERVILIDRLISCNWSIGFFGGAIFLLFNSYCYDSTQSQKFKHLDNI